MRFLHALLSKRIELVLVIEPCHPVSIESALVLFLKFPVPSGHHPFDRQSVFGDTQCVAGQYAMQIASRQQSLSSILERMGLDV